ncbi:MAG: ATP-binding protein [Candidatus Saliniplasma sp.]
MKIAVASGKGGTGKTTVAVNMALSLERDVSLFDCDVEEPNSNIFLNVETEVIEELEMRMPVIDEETCTHCGRCAELCEFNALAVLKDQVMVFEELCHACGLCSMGCPVDAISEKGRRIGVIERGSAEFDSSIIDFYQGVLDVGEALSTPLISGLKRYTEGGDEEDEKDKDRIDILDVPPGTGCPVIESLSDVDFAALVTEPTPFGLHDLKLSVEVVRKMDIPFGVIINMGGTGYEGVEDYCEDEDIPILMTIPQDMKIAKLYSNGVPFVEEMPEYRDRFKGMFSKIEKTVKEQENGVEG